jgi:nucleotide-binding universal stress UspA family protein
MRKCAQEDTAVRLFERVGFPLGHATKIIEGQHPELHLSGNAPKADALPMPELDEGERPTARRNIVVAVNGSPLDCEVMALACMIAKSKKASVYTVYGIEVPRKLAIDADMPRETESANEALSVAAQVADQYHVQIEPEIIQSRNFGQSLVEEAKAHECSLVILGLPYHVGLGGTFDLSETVDYALKNAPCRVWLVRGTPDEAASGKSERCDASHAR